MRKITFVIAAFVLLAACGGESDSVDAGTVNSAPTIVEAQSDEPAPATPEVMQTEMTENLIYHPGDEPFKGDSGSIDVIAPTEGGPYPTVVVFHGDPRYASKGWHRYDAQLIAEQGRVVFLPAWGHFDSHATSDLGQRAVLEMEKRELACAVLFAQAHTEEYGGDPKSITLYGLSAGGNAVLMAGLAGFDPLETCSVSGGPVQPQALVPIDADWTVGGHGDAEIREAPELFYLKTPWRHLDGSQSVAIHVVVPEHSGSYVRSVEPDPSTSWLSYRHSDIDLVADLDARGYLADGEFSLTESNEYAVEILLEAGYDATLVVMPGATHESWGEEGTAVVVETVLNASASATGTISLSVRDWEGMEGYRLLATAWSEDDEVMAGLSGAAFWIHVDTDPFSTQDVIHPPAIPPGDEQPWGLGDYEWEETAMLEPGTYRIDLNANPGELAPYGNYIPADPIERSCWVDVEVRAGETSTIVILDLPIGHGPCLEEGS